MYSDFLKELIKVKNYAYPLIITTFYWNYCCFWKTLTLNNNDRWIKWEAAGRSIQQAMVYSDRYQTLCPQIKLPTQKLFHQTVCSSASGLFGRDHQSKILICHVHKLTFDIKLRDHIPHTKRQIRKPTS